MATKNTVTDLRNILFAQLERLNDDELTTEQFAQEIARSKEMASIGKVIVESAKVEVLAAKVNDDYRPTNFLTGNRPIEIGAGKQ